MNNISYDLGVDKDTSDFVMRFSNDGVNYFYVGFSDLAELLKFQENLGIAIEKFKEDFPNPTLILV